jgi:hypothetical protein
MSNNRRIFQPLRAPPKPKPAVEAPVQVPIVLPQVPQEYYPPETSDFVHTTPTPTQFSKLRYFLLAAGFLCATTVLAFVLVLTSTSSRSHQLGQQPHIVRFASNTTELEMYWEFLVVNGLQSWQEIPVSGPIPNIIAPKGSVQKFEVSCMTTDGITLSKGASFDALSFDARLRYLPTDGDIKLLFYANNIELLQSKCTLFVKINS